MKEVKIVFLVIALLIASLSVHAAGKTYFECSLSYEDPDPSGFQEGEDWISSRSDNYPCELGRWNGVDSSGNEENGGDIRLAKDPTDSSRLCMEFELTNSDSRPLSSSQHTKLWDTADKRWADQYNVEEAYYYAEVYMPELYDYYANIMQWGAWSGEQKSMPMLKITARNENNQMLLRFTNKWWGGSTYTYSKDLSEIPLGRWVPIEVYIKEGSDWTTNDAEVKVWIDGKLKHDSRAEGKGVHARNWHTDESEGGLRHGFVWSINNYASPSEPKGTKLYWRNVKVTSEQQSVLPTPEPIDTYYVAKNGNDGNPGTKDEPFKTINKALRTVSEGDTIILRGGTYPERIYTKTSRLTIKNYPGEKPVIDGEYTRPTGRYGGLIQASDADGLTLIGLEIKNSAEYGIVIQRSEHAKVINCIIHNTRGGGVCIEQFSNHYLLEDSEIYNHNQHYVNGIVPEDHAAWGSAFSNGLGRTADHQLAPSNYGIIRGNKVHSGWGEGITLLHTKGSVVENNIVYDNFAMQIYVNWAQDSIVRNNVVYASKDREFNREKNWPGNCGPGISVTNEKPSETPVAPIEGYGNNVEIYNNLIADTPRGILLWSAYPEYIPKGIKIYNNVVVESYQDYQKGTPHLLVIGSQFTDVIVKNNIFLQTSGEIANVPPGLDFSHNLWSKTPDADARGVGDIIADPKLQKMTGWNNIESGGHNVDWWRLMEGSPAIDAGTSVLVSSTDYDGNTRTVPYDIGAFEYISVQVLEWDINQDGTVNILDLIRVGQRMGQSGGAEDVNNDGTINILDMILVAQHQG
ncbi:MAG: DUF1565 domain-containing protein [bacterium]|nr:DUF1565 domain-containing protein [bacterium]